MMFGLSHKRSLARSLTAVMSLSLAAPLLASVARAQDAPVVGDHYGARASDTGFAGSVNSSGGYGTSVPLDLPPARGGLPLLLSVVSGGNQFGAAGLGWDVPLSFIRRDLTIAHRRPANVANAAPQPREQLSLALGGSRTDLIRNASDTAWLARRDAAQLEVREVGSGIFEMYDGNNLTYQFRSDAEGGVGTLDNGNLYLLRNIFGPRGTKVRLDYAFGAPSLGGGSTGLSIDLASVSYNYDSTGTCPKHIVNLNYDADASAPLSLQMLGSTALVRRHKLREGDLGAIDVTARESAADSPEPCAGAMKSLRTYQLFYQAADTGQQRLHQVTMIGQEGSDERTLALPVATYSYGRFTSAHDGMIRYGLTQSIPLPSDFTLGVYGIAGTSTFTDTLDPNTDTTTLNGLFDLDGDGRPELIWGAGPGHVAHNVTGPSGTTTFVGTEPVKSDISIFGSALGRSSVRGSENPPGSHSSTNEVTQQLIDMDGDGRLDIVNSNEKDGVWVVYLNKPVLGDPTHTEWVRRTISILPMVERLMEAGHQFGAPFLITDPSQVRRLPLGRSKTANTAHYHYCWRWTGTGWVRDFNGYSGPAGNNCPGPQGENILRDDFGVVAEEGENTYVEWTFKDVNGDGYPDLIYNASPVVVQVRNGDINGAFQPPQPGNFTGQFAETDTTHIPDFTGSHAVKALINVAGVHMDLATSAFSSSVVLDADDAGCGVERWVPGFGALGRSNQVCGFEDINGDGLVDRLRTLVLQPGELTGIANLGTGDMNAPFSGATIFLPGPIARAQRQIVHVGNSFVPPTSVCPPDSLGTPGRSSYPIQRTAGLRDIDGNGIPDYILGTNARQGDPTSSTSWTVAYGTGVGFAAPVVVDSTNGAIGLELSVESVDCHGRAGLGSIAATTRGLFDLNGDGQPEVVVYNAQTPAGGASLDVYKNVELAAGRLVQIDNGYGASTKIQYHSAKEDASTLHLLPHPEIVVSLVTTTDVSGNLLAEPTQYAYGGAVQVFDSAYDRFVFPGYQRKVKMQYAGPDAPVTDGNATITDSYPFAPFNDPTIDATARFLRTAKAGRVSDVTGLSGDMGTDVLALLSTDVTRDPRRIAAAHFDYSGRLLPVGKTGNEYCVDMVYPYDYGQSLAYKDTHTDSQDQCAAHGFALQTSVTSYRGTPGTALGTADTIVSSQTVQTSASVDVFDDFGRVTSSTRHTDIVNSPNDLCTTSITDYAVPPPDRNVRVLNAPAMQTVQTCHHHRGGTAVTLAQKRYEYDGLDPRASTTVTDGFVTSSTVARYDMDSHLPLGGDIKLFDATYDSTGNLSTLTKTRDDTARKITTWSYDPFGLAITSNNIFSTGTNFERLSTTLIPDPVTLNITSTTDANGTVRGASFDGFGRVIRSTITPKGGSEGVLSSLTYNNFEAGTEGHIGDSKPPRMIVQKVFADAVPVGTEGTAPGRIATTTLDVLGRTTKMEAQLGADYQNKTVVMGQRTYDLLGRVKFLADPYLSTDSFASAYGTTQFFRTDGTLQFVTRGSGVQQTRGGIADDANEVFSTNFGRSFANNQEILSTIAPDSWGENSPQSGLGRETILSASGRVLERRTTSNREGNPRLEDVEFGYDALGHVTSMTRYQDPTNKANPVTTRWFFDSLGWNTRLEEDGVAPQTRTFDSWGEVTEVQYCGDSSQAPCPTEDYRYITRFDSMGRVTHREDRDAGKIVPGSVYDYAYDVGVGNDDPPVTPTNPLGRLTSASWSTGNVSLNYDAFGRVNTKVFTDTDPSVTPNKVYVEQHGFHDDGSVNTLHLLLPLPDNGFQDESVTYDYDTAGRVKSAVYSRPGESSQSLFSAADRDPIYDEFGRITSAQYGLARFNATFAAAGRRLLTDVKVRSGDLLHSRGPSFTVLNGVTPFDPMGRERHRTEFVDNSDPHGPLPIVLLRSYDQIGRLRTSEKLQIATNTIQADRAFTYDPLGNILTQDDASTGHPGSVSLSYGPPDFDRICGVAYGTATAPQPPACNVTYDSVGNIISMPTNANSIPGTSGTRTFIYFPSGAVKKIADGGTEAIFDYDPFGELQQLTLNTVLADPRADKYFGAYIKQRVEGGNQVITRQIPVPGATAIRHGPTTNLTWTLAEARGTRFVVNQNGDFVQTTDYQPFGEVKNPTGATPGTTNYANQQWNGGDFLASLGVVKVGARPYDPGIGRFLSRDPLLLPRTAATTNPYAFAFNDPINGSDPTGLDGDAQDFDVTKQLGNGDWVQKGETIEVKSSAPGPKGPAVSASISGPSLSGPSVSRVAERIFRAWVSIQNTTPGIVDSALGVVADPVADAFVNHGGLKGACAASANLNCTKTIDTPKNREEVRPYVRGMLRLGLGIALAELAPSLIEDLIPSVKAPKAPYVRNANIPGGRSFPAGKFPSLTLPDTVTERVGNFLLRQARGIVAGLPKAERAEALKLYVTRTIPRAARDWGPTLIVDSDTEALIYFSGEGGGPGEGDLVYAIGVNPATSELYVGRVDVNILERLGFGTPGFGPWP